MTSERRLQVADMTAQGMKPKEIADALGYSKPEGVYSALQNPDVKEQVKWHRDNLFEQSRIDRVELLRDLYESITCPTGPIFAALQGPDSDSHFLLASNLPNLTDVQSKLIQQIELTSMALPSGVLDDDGQPVKVQTSVISKIRFHSPDAARKILAKAAGFEDGLDASKDGDKGGPFRGMIIIPPEDYASKPFLGEGPPENPNSHLIEGSDS